MKKWKIKLAIIILIILVIETIWLLAVLIPGGNRLWRFGWLYGFANGVLIIIIGIIFFIRFLIKRGKKPEETELTKESRFTKEEAEKLFRLHLMREQAVQPTKIRGIIEHHGKGTKQAIYTMETSDLWNGMKYYGIMNLVTGEFSLEDYESLHEKEMIDIKLGERASSISEEPEIKQVRRVRIIDSQTGNERVIEEPISEAEVIKEKHIEEEKKEVIGEEE